MDKVYLVIYGYYGEGNLHLTFVNAESKEEAKEQVIDNKGLCYLDTVKICSLSDIEMVFK